MIVHWVLGEVVEEGRGWRVGLLWIGEREFGFGDLLGWSFLVGFGCDWGGEG